MIYNNKRLPIQKQHPSRILTEFGGARNLNINLDIPKHQCFTLRQLSSPPLQTYKDSPRPTNSSFVAESLPFFRAPHDNLTFIHHTNPAIMASSYQPSAGRRTITSSRSSTPSQTHTTTVAIHAPPQQPVLRLRGASTDSDSAIEEGSARRRRIQWAEDVIDNEGLGRKKSKGMLRLPYIC